MCLAGEKRISANDLALIKVYRIFLSKSVLVVNDAKRKRKAKQTKDNKDP